MQIKSTDGFGSNVFGADLSTRLEELSQKAKDKAASLKTDEQADATGVETANTTAAEGLDFTSSQERSAFLNSLQSGGQSSETQSDKLLSQHALDPERVAQLLGL